MRFARRRIQKPNVWAVLLDQSQPTGALKIIKKVWSANYWNRPKQSSRKTGIYKILTGDGPFTMLSFFTGIVIKVHCDMHPKDLNCEPGSVLKQIEISDRGESLMLLKSYLKEPWNISEKNLSHWKFFASPIFEIEARAHAIHLSIRYRGSNISLENSLSYVFSCILLWAMCEIETLAT